MRIALAEDSVVMTEAGRRCLLVDVLREVETMFGTKTLSALATGVGPNHEAVTVPATQTCV